jgi:hypothetical protein
VNSFTLVTDGRPPVARRHLMVFGRRRDGRRIPSINPNEVRPPEIAGWGMTEYLTTLAMIGIVIILIAENCA